MKRFFLSVIFFSFFCSIASAQQPSVVLIHVQGVPTSVCTTDQIFKNDLNGDLYDCLNKAPHLIAGTGTGNVSTSGSPSSGQTAEFSGGTTITGVSQTGTGNYVKATSPTLVTPNLGTPSAINLLNATNPPIWNQNTTGTAAGLSGTPALPNGTTATTQSPGDNSTKIATTAYVAANGSGLPTLPTSPNGVAQSLTSTPSGGVGGAAAWSPPGVSGRAVTGTASTDTILATDCTNRVEYVGSVAVGITLPTATTLGVSKCVFKVTNNTSGSSTALTITPTTWTIRGSSTLTVAQGQIATIYVDPNSSTNWVADITEGAVANGSGLGVARTANGETLSLNSQYQKGQCTEVWGGSGTSFALTSGDDAISNNSCYNDSGVTRTITAVKCRSDNASNTTTVNPTFGSAGTGTTILSGALTCGNSLAYSSTGTVSNASWTTGTGINPVMGGTLTGTSIAVLVEYTF